MKNSIRATFVIEIEDKERVENIAKQMGVSSSWIIRKILKDYPDQKIFKLMIPSD